MTKIEEVARVICIGVGLNPDGPDGLHAQDEQVHVNWESFRMVARAAITAMKNPDHDMTAAVLDPCVDRTSTVQSWNKMIDAALNDR